MPRMLILLTLCAVASGATYSTGSFVLDERSAVVVPANSIPCCETDYELVENPGFETGQLAPWTSTNWRVDTVFPHGGQYCASDVGNFSISQAFDTVPGFEITRVSFWTRQPESAIQAVYLHYDDGTRDQTIVNPEPYWTEADVTGLLNPNKKLVGITIWGYSGGPPGPDSSYIDDVSITVRDPVRDGAVVEIVCPRDTVEYDTTHFPEALVANLGNTGMTMPVIMRLEDICRDDPYYFDTVEVSVGAGETLSVRFAEWRPDYPALHRARCWVAPENDTNPSNDTLEHFFQVARMTGVAEPGHGVTAGRLQVAPTVGPRFAVTGCAGSVRLADALGRTAWRATAVDGRAACDGRALRLAPGVYFVRSGRATCRVVLTE